MQPAQKRDTGTIHGYIALGYKNSVQTHYKVILQPLLSPLLKVWDASSGTSLSSELER